MPRKSNSSPSASKRGSSRKKEAEDVVEEPGDESQPTARKRKSSPSTSTRASSKKKKEAEEILEEPEDESQEEEIAPFFLNPKVNPKKVKKSSPKTKVKKVEEDPDCRFIGEALPEAEARQRWPKRYQETKPQLTSASNNLDEIEDVMEACCHYTKAEVDGQLFNLYDDAYVKAEEGQPDYICKIVEMFEAVDGSPYFTAQWFYRAKDTVIKDHAYLIDDKRVFFSKVKDDNPLDCLVKRLNIAKVPLNIDTDIKKESIPICDYYYDMLYLLPYSTFVNVPANAGVEDPNLGVENDSSSTISDNSATDVKADTEEVLKNGVDGKPEMLLLDLYAGCGAMSTGICLGANTSGVNLLTRWAVDINEHACASLKSNHPETEVRNEAAEDFLSLLSEWKKLCAYFSLVSGDSEGVYFNPIEVDDNDNDEESDDDNAADDEVFEVEKILEVCYGDPNAKKEPGLYFKVRWRGYGPDHDTWEPIDGLRDCRERMKEFVVNGYNSKILPLPGDADVICGGPPCQGISGFNRFRNKDNPLDDPKNKQLLVYMNIVEYLKPKYVLMENVVDILKFAEGFIARYALGRLIQMNYQTRMGMMAAGAYGLPQFRMRVFLWGARPTEKLPSYPLPTHDVVKRGVTPLEFEDHVVAYEAGHAIELKERLFLKDAISDLPHVMNGEERDEIPYGQPPQTKFQRFIRRRKDGSLPDVSKPLLFDHRPYKCNEDDYERVCCIPKRKGANFRDLPGVFVRSDNKVEFDPAIPRALVKSGKPLVPDYAMSFTKGTSSKPFARLWWDETVPTVVTRPEPHNQKIIHPEQDRVLSIRENARLQGFPDYYKLYGPVKQRYMQVGNAVAVPVARALGYALGMACQGSVGDEAVFNLPSDFTR